MQNTEQYNGDMNLENSNMFYMGKEFHMDASMTLMQFIDVWLEVFKKNTVKASAYARLLVSQRALSGYSISQKKISDIGFFDIQNYLNELVSTGYGMSTVKKQLQIVVGPIKQAAAMKLIQTDPTYGIRLPKETNLKKATKKIRAYDKDQQELFLKELKKKPIKMFIMCICFMIETGLRVGEVLALQWSDINIDKCKMHIHRTVVNPNSQGRSYVQEEPKTHASVRDVPLTPMAIAILKQLQKTASNEFVFEDRGGSGRYSYKALCKSTKKMCQKYSIPFYGMHAFRHTFATNCYYKGVDVKILSRILGHADVKTTYNTYIDLYGDGFDEMYAALVL